MRKERKQGFVFLLLRCAACLCLLGLASTPWASGNEDYLAGEELYDLGCANCHGKNLVNPGTASFNLKSFPKDQKQRFVRSVIEGKGFMPPMGAMFDAGEIEQLWIYVSQHP